MGGEERVAVRWGGVVMVCGSVYVCTVVWCRVHGVLCCVHDVCGVCGNTDRKSQDDQN